MSNIYIMCIYLYVWCVCVNTTCVFTLFNCNLKIIFDPEVFWSGVCVYTYIHTCICCESNWVRIYQWIYMRMGLPKWFSGKESAQPCKRYWRHDFYPWVRKIPWRRMWQSTLIFLLDKSHGQRSMVGQQSMESQRAGHAWACKQWEWYMCKQMHIFVYINMIACACMYMWTDIYDPIYQPISLYVHTDDIWIYMILSHDV